MGACCSSFEPIYTEPLLSTSTTGGAASCSICLLSTALSWDLSRMGAGSQCA